MLKTLMRFKLWAFPPQYADTNAYRYIVVGMSCVMGFLFGFEIAYDPHKLFRCLFMIAVLILSALLIVVLSKQIDRFFS